MDARKKGQQCRTHKLLDCPISNLVSEVCGGGAELWNRLRCLGHLLAAEAGPVPYSDVMGPAAALQGPVAVAHHSCVVHRR